MNPLKSLPESELKKMKALTKKEIVDALKQGKKDADRYLANCSLRGFYR